MDAYQLFDEIPIWKYGTTRLLISVKLGLSIFTFFFIYLINRASFTFRFGSFHVSFHFYCSKMRLIILLYLRIL
jgi:hypothetical protein